MNFSVKPLKYAVIYDILTEYIVKAVIKSAEIRFVYTERDI